MGTKEKKYWFAFGVALGFATIAAALWWVRRQRRPRRQPLVLEIVSGQPVVAASS